MADTLSEAALDYGRAFCVPDTEAGVPFNQLPAEQQACVTRVGTTWATKVEQAMGAGTISTPVPAIPEVIRGTVSGPTGTELGTVTYADGTVTLCLTPQSGTRQCTVVGSGHDAYEAAVETLKLMGLQTHATP